MPDKRNSCYCASILPQYADGIFYFVYKCIEKTDAIKLFEIVNQYLDSFDINTILSMLLPFTYSQTYKSPLPNLSTLLRKVFF